MHRMKKLLTGMVIFILTTVSLCGFSFIQTDSVAMTAAQDQAESMLVMDQPEPQAKEAEQGKLDLILTGDLMCQHRQQKYYYHKEKEIYDFDPQLDYVRELLEQADLTIGNLETNISTLEPLGKEQKSKYGNPYLNSPVEFMDTLKTAGFDVLVNANNHNADTGVAGMYETLRQMDAYGFEHTGMFTGGEEDRFLILEQNGIKLGIASYAGFFNRSIRDFTEVEQDVYLNAYAEEKMARDLDAMKEKGAEYIIVYLHSGKEFTHQPTERQYRWGQQIADAGADYVVMSHSHTVQPTGEIYTVDGRTVPVAYSLGNFVSHMKQENSSYGMVLSLTLEKEEEKVALAEQHYYPTYLLEDNKDTGMEYQVIPCTEEGIEAMQDPKQKEEIRAARDYIISIAGYYVTPEE